MSNVWEKYSHIIPFIAVDSGVIDSVAGWVSSNNYKNILVVTDPNTRRAAGEKVINSLKSEGLSVFECNYKNEEPIPDEFSIGFLTAAYTPDIDLILAIGSGTINDICTFVGARVGCPSAVVGTAPSMDGYASLGSAMMLGGVKVTPPTQCPVAIFCDIDILKDAPMLLTAAGLGDMLGKITALADWSLAHLLTGEPKPEEIVALVKDALDKIVSGAPHLARREPNVIKSVTEGLILSGIAMSLYGDSRPASRTEHHLAHFWEMRMLAEGIKPALHGIKVGLATIVGLIIWKKLASSLDDYIFAKENKNQQKKSGQTTKPETCADYESDIRRLYGFSAKAILQTKNPNLSIEFIKKNKQEILDIANKLPSPDDISAMLSAVDAPVSPSEILLSGSTLHDSIIYARDRKKVYTVLQLLGDLGCLEDFAESVSMYFAKNTLSGIKCFIMDMDGTMYLSDTVFPYTGSFLELLDKSGNDYIFYTNNSSQNSEYYLKKLRGMGIAATPDKLLMSTHVLLAHLEELKKGNNNDSQVAKLPRNNKLSRVFVAGTKALKDDFENAGYILTDTDPDFAVLGFDTDMDYKRLRMLCDFVRAGLPYYGVHIDYNCPIEGGFMPDCGSLAAAVAASTGITPEFFGKPSRYTLDYIIKKTGYGENELCFIGDRLYTDVAITSGTKARSVLVLSGETKRNDLADSLFVPDIVANDLEELMSYFYEY